MDRSTPSHQSSTLSSTQQSPTTTKIVPPAPATSNTSASTDPFLKDFTLVAEAAKRAQMAVLMRDFESVGL
ncbi:hypothetical protein C8A05DRAFT_35424 [Staphylotrichum tortipilum]|uniref:Uncharacterized protein n=1 Tax=Staphylotrichum tortipilum TaxID=2831512 RepID=A0AAN6MIW1_9PEZI|nr:hypothetical protein C8A05DRAFT_35424 [Staphylotrichum longicolle]